MRIANLSRIDCLFLHNRLVPLEHDAVVELVRSLAADMGYPSDLQVLIPPASTDVNISLGGYRIDISQYEHISLLEKFSSYLDRPYTNAIFPGAKEIVGKHRACTSISIYKLDPQSTEHAMFAEDKSSLKAIIDHEEAYGAMEFAAHLARCFEGFNPACAVYWSPGDLLMSPDFFRRNCEGEMFLLNMFPTVYSDPGRADDIKTLSMQVTGTQWLMGRTLEISEAPVSFAWMMQASMAFIRLCQTIGEIPHHMQTFTMKGQDWRVGVLDERLEDENGWNKIRLTPVHVPQFGIIEDEELGYKFDPKHTADLWTYAERDFQEVEAIGQHFSFETSNLDPEDQLDSAILERLRDMDGQAPATSATLSVPTLNNAPALDAVDLKPAEFEKEKTRPAPREMHKSLEPWSEPTHKTDVSALRELVAGSDDNGVNDSSNEGSILGRLGGMFARK